MRSVWAVARRILTQFALDKRTLALLFVAPLVVIWLLSILLAADTVGPKIATVDLPQEFQSQLDKTDARITNTSMQEATDLLKANKIAAVLYMGNDEAANSGSLESQDSDSESKDSGSDPSDTLMIWLEGTDSSKTAAVMGVVAEALGDMRKAASDEIENEIDQTRA